VKIEIMREAGYYEALYGIGLSYNIVPDFWKLEDEDKEKLYAISLKLCSKDGGHNKFLESMQVWIDITAPRYWWQEADTYRVGCSKQSQSTMHTISKRYLEQSDFVYPIDDSYLMKLNELVAYHNTTKDIDSFLKLKNMLPEGFLQRRIWNLNYKVLRNIFKQRKNHRLPEWKYFCINVFNNLEFAEYMEDIMK